MLQVYASLRIKISLFQKTYSCFAVLLMCNLPPRDIIQPHLNSEISPLFSFMFLWFGLQNTSKVCHYTASVLNSAI